MKAMFIFSLIFDAVLWLCFAAATVEMLVFDNPTAINGVIGAGLGGACFTVLVVWIAWLRRVEP